MADPQIVTTLRSKRDELERQIKALEAQLEATRVTLAHVNAVAQLYEAGDGPVQYPVHMDLSRLFKRGEMWRLASAALEAIGGPMTTREIAEHVMQAKGWDVADKVLRTSVTYRLVQALTMQAKRGRLTSPRKAGTARVWNPLHASQNRLDNA